MKFSTTTFLFAIIFLFLYADAAVVVSSESKSKPKPVLVNLKSEASKDKAVTLSWELNKAINTKSIAVIGVKKGVCDSEGCKFVTLNKTEVNFSDKTFTFEGVDLDLKGINVATIRGVTKDDKAYGSLTFAKNGLPEVV